MRYGLSMTVEVVSSRDGGILLEIHTEAGMAIVPLNGEEVRRLRKFLNELAEEAQAVAGQTTIEA